MGYSAYTKPGVQIKKGQWLGEYLGELRPIDVETTSKYVFVIPKKCLLDAEKAGNWTRFINSDCRPNVQCWADCLGKRSVMLFQAKKDIGPEEELTINYQKAGFKKAGFSCKCSKCDPSMHVQSAITVDEREIRHLVKLL